MNPLKVNDDGYNIYSTPFYNIKYFCFFLSFLRGISQHWFSSGILCSISHLVNFFAILGNNINVMTYV